MLLISTWLASISFMGYELLLGLHILDINETVLLQKLVLHCASLWINQTNTNNVSSHEMKSANATIKKRTHTK